MKTDCKTNHPGILQLLLRGFLAINLAGLLALPCHAIPPRSVVEAAAAEKDDVGTPAEDTGLEKDKVDGVETTDGESAATKAAAWLGVSTAEASEALASQLDLQAGVGLVVTYVVKESPAAKAGLRKNDVLASFDDQALVHPAQLRKLVRSRTVGDTVKLGFYRAGKLQTVSVSLGKTSVPSGPFDQEQRNLENGLRELQKQLKDMHLDVVIRDQMKAAGDALGSIKIDQNKLQEDIRYGMDEARKSLREALRNVTNAEPSLGPVKKMLEDLAGSAVAVANDASVTVRSSGKGVKSIVNTDDSGIIVLISDPKLHLTAHDKEGHLVFDGEIETAAQRSKVPHDLWDRVEPLLGKMNATPAEEPEEREAQ